MKKTAILIWNETVKTANVGKTFFFSCSVKSLHIELSDNESENGKWEWIMMKWAWQHKMVISISVIEYPFILYSIETFPFSVVFPLNCCVSIRKYSNEKKKKYVFIYSEGQKFEYGWKRNHVIDYNYSDQKRDILTTLFLRLQIYIENQIEFNIQLRSCTATGKRFIRSHVQITLENQPNFNIPTTVQPFS